MPKKDGNHCRGRRAAKKGDELAPFHSISSVGWHATLLASASKSAGIAERARRCPNAAIPAEDLTASVGHRRRGGRPAVPRLAPMPREHLCKIDHYSAL